MKRYLISCSLFFILFVLLLFVGGSASGQDRIKEEVSFAEEETLKAQGHEFNERGGTTMGQESRSISDEQYHPYPENFMIPKGVCEKSEPVMVITK
jgi:hypothetical protein